MEDKEPRIPCAEHEDELEEELFFLRINMDLLKKKNVRNHIFTKWNFAKKKLK